MSWQDIMKDEQTDEMVEANRHLSESLEVAIRVYSQLKELVDEDNHIMKPKEVDTLARQISETMQRVSKSNIPRSR